MELKFNRPISDAFNFGAIVVVVLVIVLVFLVVLVLVVDELAVVSADKELVTYTSK